MTSFYVLVLPSLKLSSQFLHYSSCSSQFLNFSSIFFMVSDSSPYFVTILVCSLCLVPCVFACSSLSILKMTICILVWAMCRSLFIGNAAQNCDVPFVIFFFFLHIFGLSIDGWAVYEMVNIKISFYIVDLFIIYQEGKKGIERGSETSVCWRNVGSFPLACPQLGSWPEFQLCDVEFQSGT